MRLRRSEGGASSTRERLHFGALCATQLQLQLGGSQAKCEQGAVNMCVCVSIYCESKAKAKVKLRSVELSWLRMFGL